MVKQITSPDATVGYWLATGPALLDALGQQSGLSRIEVAEILVEVERDMSVNGDVPDTDLILAYLELLGEGQTHGKHTHSDSNV